MMAQKIERADTIPLIISILMKIGVQQVIDSIFIPHGSWSGLSYGQLVVLFVTCVLHSLTHRFSGMESWANRRKMVMERAAGWQTGENDEAVSEYQLQMGQSIIIAYQLPTQIALYDTAGFNVYHDAKNGILEFGRGKDYRPAALDPAGVPILSETLSGNRAGDPCYLSAWRRMVKTIGRPDFLFIADCKAAPQETRGAINHEKGYYLSVQTQTQGQRHR